MLHPAKDDEFYQGADPKFALGRLGSPDILFAVFWAELQETKEGEQIRELNGKPG